MFLENDILWQLKSIGKDNFYVFYPLSEAQFKRVRVDQIMDISMYDIWFGSQSTNNYSYVVTKQVSETVPGQKDPVKVTVTATVNVTRQVIDSRGVMDCRITDTENRSIVFFERFPAQYTWENLSGTYSGDARALSSRDNAIVNGSYKNPLSYDELYRELSKQVLSDFNFKMRRLYGK
jgi:hypothetical protein